MRVFPGGAERTEGRSNPPILVFPGGHPWSWKNPVEYHPKVRLTAPWPLVPFVIAIHLTTRSDHVLKTDRLEIR
jgi:hypothetical protein